MNLFYTKIMQLCNQAGGDDGNNDAENTGRQDEEKDEDVDDLPDINNAEGISCSRVVDLDSDCEITYKVILDRAIKLY